MLPTTDATHSRLETLHAERNEVLRQLDATYLTCPVLDLVTLLERAQLLHAQIHEVVEDLRVSAAIAAAMERSERA